MITIISGLILVFGCVYFWLAVRNISHQTVPLIIVGLWLLGFLNILGGSGALLADYSLGAGPIVIGVVSIELGAILAGFWQSPSGPNWDMHALRIAIEVFVVGLLITSL